MAVLYILVLSIGTLLSLYIPKNEVTANDAIVIPHEAIRLRILANSDLEIDQTIKRMVRDEVNAEITKWVENLTSLEDARMVIQSKLPEIQKIAEAVIESQGATQTVQTAFEKVQFPTKLYGQFLYPAGEYEAILITLGEGEGANWWCVLFPPLCFLDFSNGVAVSDGFDENEKEAADAEKTASDPQANEAVKNTEEGEAAAVSEKEAAPVYEKGDEEPVKVRFFLVDLWDKLFG
ncbi:stage II sporulation protein R [Mesobacillus harenae]|uniref:stage II sporulation protein R n=1 Tax=Mesobacillus harenae TaxID=2213203 RepID=UPI001580E626|nr:stage II sporulation protein R [Mesobacillus harenae]